MTWDEILWERSFMNIIMMGKSIPEYDEKGEKKTGAKPVTGRDLFEKYKK